MNHARLALTTLLFLVSTRASDLVVTFYFNPSLDREANLIVRVLGGGARSLVAISVIEVVSLSGALLLFWRGPYLSELCTNGGSFRNFVARWLTEVIGSRDPFTAWMPGGPRSTHSVQAIRLVGVALSWAMIFGSLAAVYAWFVLMINFSDRMRAVFTSLSFGSTTVVPYLAALLGFCFGALLFFISEYSRTRRRCAMEPHRADSRR